MIGPDDCPDDRARMIGATDDRDGHANDAEKATEVDPMGGVRVSLDALSEGDTAAVDRIKAFATAHPAPVTAVVNHMGRRGARIVVIAADGVFGDVVVSSVAAAERVCAEADVTVGTWDRQTSALLTPEPVDRKKMRGTGR
jgi:hypothetical protein